MKLSIRKTHLSGTVGDDGGEGKGMVGLAWEEPKKSIGEETSEAHGENSTELSFSPRNYLNGSKKTL